MGEGGFANSRYIFNQQVAAGEQTGDTILGLVRFSDNHRVKLI